MLSNGFRCMNPPTHELPIAWGYEGQMATRGLVAPKVTYTCGADPVYWKLNDSTLTANGATELALIGFAGHLVQQFDIRETRHVGAEQQRHRKCDREYSSRPQYNLTEKHLNNHSITTVDGHDCKANS
ncbi:hypothetical protein BwSH20_47470 [Bradyrhizobium ottawaense]|nr:hypothetical protein TM233_21040 [Bradyrhizobium sp. TM233]GMO63632.1 hypothetical protein BwSG10_13840 [Bradyrhizobium ottawaense]GMO77771.1 hypothetical protein BwSG20_52690 [Bradyrhizobium ottawaense]GMO94769.1 hypothetical protein BwDG23_13840 [Bradyrhizobium ottawaense]GMP05954.1 hypothetical protein BwSH20_47470 [Bradyrhizobium ottawaense]